MEQFMPVEIFQKKVIPFKVLPFSFLTEMIKIFCTTCLDYQCQASCQEEVKYFPVIL